MIDFLLRFCKRLLVLVPGLAAAYLVATDVYPVLDRQIPAPLAVLTAYIIAAYGVIPAFLRILRFLIRPKHIPLYCITADGFTADPVNIGLLGTRQQVIKAMQAAGWYNVDKLTIRSFIQVGLAYIFKRPYPTAPFSNLYLFGRKQDLSFQLPIGDTPHERHHVRFWAAAPKLSPNEQAHIDFWQRLHPNKTAARQQLWVGAASRDIGIGFIGHNAQLTHAVHPDINAERDLIIASLKKTGQVAKTQTTYLGEAYKLRSRVFRSHLHTDGKMTVATLKN